MWGSIPYHAHHFLVRFAIGVRTTIELIKIEIILLKNQWGYSAACHSCTALVDIQSAGDAESLVRLPHTCNLVLLPAGTTRSSSG